jgi:hypothetical protein
MKKYAIVNQNNIVENIALWDGVTQWDLEENQRRFEIIGSFQPEIGNLVIYEGDLPIGSMVIEPEAPAP